MGLGMIHLNNMQTKAAHAAASQKARQNPNFQVASAMKQRTKPNIRMNKIRYRAKIKAKSRG